MVAFVNFCKTEIEKTRLEIRKKKQNCLDDRVVEYSFVKNKNKNKEKSSFSEYLIQIQTTCQKLFDNPHMTQQRPLLCTSCKKKSYKASVTVEISMVVPLFLLGLLCLIFLLEMMTIQLSVRAGMEDVARIYGSTQLTRSDISDREMELVLISALGATAMDSSIIRGGSDGLDLSKTEVDERNGAVKLIVSYDVLLPMPRFMNLGMAYEETLVFKRWTGYEGGAYFTNGQMVYITEHQSVYHTDPSCTHLQLQISMVEANSIPGLSNENQSGYTSCGNCKPGSSDNWDYVYVTATGSGYHSTLECSSLKRTVVSVSIEDIIGKGVCQRCSGV